MIGKKNRKRAREAEQEVPEAEPANSETVPEWD